MSKRKKLFSTNKKAETVKERTVQNSQLTFEFVLSQIFRKPVEILETGFSEIFGLEDPTWRYIQFMTLNPDGTRSRYELGNLREGEYFNLLDEVYEVETKLDEVSNAI